MQYGIYPSISDNDDGAYQFDCVPPAFGSMYQTLKQKTFRKNLKRSKKISSSFSEKLVSVLKNAYMATKSNHEDRVEETEDEEKDFASSWTLIEDLEIQNYNPSDACDLMTSSYEKVRPFASLVDRGTCTFVEKASHVETSGAKLMIVGRTDEKGKPFVMSGGENENDQTEARLIPSVMVDKLTMERLRRFKSQYSSTKVSVHIIEEPFSPYPNIRFEEKENTISVYPSHEENLWSIDIKYPDTEDPDSVWQLFVRERT